MQGCLFIRNLYLSIFIYIENFNHISTFYFPFSSFLFVLNSEVCCFLARIKYVNFECLYTSKLWLYFNKIYWIVIRYIWRGKKIRRRAEDECEGGRKRIKKKFDKNGSNGESSLNSSQVIWAGKRNMCQSKFPHSI